MTAKGTYENPFDNLSDALDACDGSGKCYWVHNPDSRTFIWVDDVSDEDTQLPDYLTDDAEWWIDEE